MVQFVLDGIFDESLISGKREFGIILAENY